MKQFTSREQLLLTLLPSVLVLAIYGWFFLKPMNQEIRDIQKGIQAEQKKAPAETAKRKLQADEKQFRKTLNQHQRKIAEAEHQIEHFYESRKNKSAIETLSRMMELFQKHQMILLEESTFLGNNSFSKLETIQFYEKKIMTEKRLKTEQFRRFSFLAPFTSTQHFFEELWQQQIFVYVVKLEMKQGKNTNQGFHEWDLIVWL